ncbi:MAG TPA: hypothetical protein VF116_23085 [Ktedonobacterales bacterium]
MTHDDDARWSGWPKPTRWGELTQLPNGHWRTTWQIALESLDATRVEDVAATATHRDAGFAVELTPHGQSDLMVTIDTSRWGQEVDYYGLTYELFRLIDSRLGRIRFIQGSPREWWSPFVSH